MDQKKNFVFGEVEVKSDKGELLAEVLAIFIIPKREADYEKSI